MTALSLVHPPTLIWVLAAYFCFAVLGRLVVKDNFVLGAALAYVISSGAAAIAYTFCHVFDLGPIAFWSIFIFLGLFVFWVATRIVKENEYSFQLNVDYHTFIYLLICVTFVLVFTFLTTISVTDASAATQFFQAWNPIIAAHIADTGEFRFSSDANLKMGMLLSSDYYAVNTRGLIVAVALLGISDMPTLFYLYNALSVLATILAFTLLLQTVFSRKSFFPAVIFLLLATYFALTEANTRTILVSNLSDEVLYLSTAGAIFALFFNIDSKNWQGRLKVAVFFAIFMAIGRNYGLAWFGALSLAYVLYLLVKSIPTSIEDAVVKLFVLIKNDWALWLVAILITGKEILQIILFGTQFPRIAISTGIEYHWPQLQAAILNGMNILYTSNGYLFTLHSVYLPVLIICVGFFWYLGGRKNIPKLIFLPLVFLAFPVFLEILLQFRKSLNFNKLYVPIIIFSVWYSAWCIKYLVEYASGTAISKMKVPIISLSIFFVVFVGWVESSPRHRKTQVKDAIAFHGKMITDRFNGFVRYNRHEQGLMDQLKESLEPEHYENLIAHPVMYFHYEPGLGYRYFLGGDIGDDFDFFSPSTFKKIQKSASAKDFFCSLGMPNLLMYLIKDRIPYFTIHKNYYPAWMKSTIDQTVLSAGYQQAADVRGLRLYVSDKTVTPCPKSN